MDVNAALGAEQIRLVLEVSRLLAGTADLNVLLTRIAESATSLLGCHRASIFLHDAANKQLWTKVALGATEIRVPDDRGVVGNVFQTRQLLHIPDAYADSRFNRDVDRRTGFLTKNLLTAPMLDLNGRAVGVIQAVNAVDGQFSGSDSALLQLLADQAGVAVQRYQLQQAVVDTAALKREMDLARSVQQMLIPKRPPVFPGYDMAGYTRPASSTGGDLFDYWPLPDGRLGIFLADAAGHGLAPALVVSQARTLIRTLSNIKTDPQWLLEQVNNRLADDLDPSRFVTAFMGCLSSDGLLQWYSAGHGPTLYRPRRGAAFTALEPQAPPLGVMSDAMTDPVEPVRLEPGGTLFVMSDGIFESIGRDGEQFGTTRVLDLLATSPFPPPAALLVKVTETMTVWQGKDDALDDQTVVVVQRTMS